MLKKHNMLSSMSRKGDCWGNAVMESFFESLKTERVHRDRYKDHREARTAAFKYIETFYNTNRMHSTLGNLSPNEFEAEQSSKPNAA